MIILLNQSLHHSFLVLFLIYDTKYNANEVIALKQFPKAKGEGGSNTSRRKKKQSFFRSPENANILLCASQRGSLLLKKENDFEQERTQKNTIAPRDVYAK